MNSIKRCTTVQSPSAFGMPISGGHAFDVTTDARTATIVRERAGIVAAVRTGATDGDMGLAQSYFPGTTAWRPPTC